MPTVRKIINDPVHGFITINHPLLFKIIEHPYFQRLRRIKQMAMASYVYPGAVHTRLHHALGAYHLMCCAVKELKDKDIPISQEEELAVKCAILLHDIGHGPFSHALEHILVEGVHHESLSLKIMQAMNEEFNGALDLTIDIFTGKYAKPFLHQLISGQLDMDRMDYLSRDSFFTGVSEGVIGYDRILKMLAVKDNQLVVEEKGVHSVEKFLIARRQMYWQVYLHKTVISAEKMLVHILKRAKEIFVETDKNIVLHSPLDYFFGKFDGKIDFKSLNLFCQLDDNDIEFAIKKWSQHPDSVLSGLSTWLLNRALLKCKLQTHPFEEDYIKEKKEKIASKFNLTKEEVGYFVFTGDTTNTTYQLGDENILILFKNGQVQDISSIENALIQQTLSTPVKKFYICFPKGQTTVNI
ncbi:MAG TPA: HD domain-containing protein [Arachidicoccus soli]|uniref:HD domain-containing protein n=1 Tax=Arachidicoccus soli TaxID=2341117 RepID=A0A386HSN2_9BACT|nr:HD domain-containing protein [Arachidicoccus soli]AYD48712.1 HD domain-containing protein [Arachidicoccus soli]HEU0226895.1 HD domain-containing protein [Arachidicoccus soli]